MPIEETLEMIEFLAGKGTKAVTITGGGEPILYKDLSLAIDEFDYFDIKMGLVSNGELLYKLPVESLQKLTWCRISASDERPLPLSLQKVIETVTIDWAFSYVLSDKPNVHNIKIHAKFAEKNDFTHMRVVSDLLHIADINMEETQKQINSDLIIWQGRKEWTQGNPECRISLLKPLIGPDGLIYPCCGVQYAHEEPALDLPKSMSMGHWSTIGDIMFNGSHCVKCYYHDYNAVLAQMDSDLQHLDFV